MARAWEAALGIGGEEGRALLLAIIAPQLTGEARTQARKAGLAAALAIKDEENRLWMLNAYLTVTSDLAAVLCDARQTIADHLLKNLATSRRERVLQFCANRDLFAPPFFDQDTLAAIAGHIVEVCEEWRWM